MRVHLAAAALAIAAAVFFGGSGGSIAQDRRQTGTYCTVDVQLYIVNHRNCETVDGYGNIVRRWSFWWSAIAHF